MTDAFLDKDYRDRKAPRYAGQAPIREKLESLDTNPHDRRNGYPSPVWSDTLSG